MCYAIYNRYLFYASIEINIRNQGNNGGSPENTLPLATRLLVGQVVVDEMKSLVHLSLKCIDDNTLIIILHIST